VRRALTVAPARRGRKRQTFFGFNHDNIILHGGKILLVEAVNQVWITNRKKYLFTFRPSVNVLMKDE